MSSSSINQNGGWSRRSFMKATAVVAGAGTAGLVLPQTALARPGPDPHHYHGFHRPGWDLVFHDDFQFFDKSKWGRFYSPNRYSKHQDVHWAFLPENVYVKDGKLVIQMVDNGDGTYSSGSARTSLFLQPRPDDGYFQNYQPGYGYFEARVKVTPRYSGVHSAFWLLSDGVYQVGNDGRDGSEIDIFEAAYDTDIAGSNFHWDGYGADHKTTRAHTWDAPGIRDGYHIYGLDWGPTTCKFYYDGELKWTYSGPGVPQVGEAILFSSGVSFADGNIREATFPVNTYVDWVRVYQPRRHHHH